MPLHLKTECLNLKCSMVLIRAVTKILGLGTFLGYYEHETPATFIGNKRKIEPKVLPCCAIPLLLNGYTQQLEILATALVPNLSMVYRLYMAPLSPNSDQQQFSPNDIHTLS